MLEVKHFIKMISEIVIIAETTVSDYSKAITSAKTEILKYFGTSRTEIEDDPSPCMYISGEVTDTDLEHLNHICDSQITLIAVTGEESKFDAIKNHIIKL